MVLTLPERFKIDPPILVDEFKGVTLISFGYHYTPITKADLIVDLRTCMDSTPFTDWWDTGKDFSVKNKIYTRYGKLVELFSETVKEMAFHNRSVTAAFGCERGFHRSVGTVELIYGLVERYYPTKVVHRDLHKASN